MACFDQFCRLCLVKERILIPIFGKDTLYIFEKIKYCLPVNVAENDELPKNICGACLSKLEHVYLFCNSTSNAEMQLLKWLDESKTIAESQTITTTLETEELVLKDEIVEEDHILLQKQHSNSAHADINDSDYPSAGTYSSIDMNGVSKNEDPNLEFETPELLTSASISLACNTSMLDSVSISMPLTKEVPRTGVHETPVAQKMGSVVNTINDSLVTTFQASKESSLGNITLQYNTFVKQEQSNSVISEQSANSLCNNTEREIQVLQFNSKILQKSNQYKNCTVLSKKRSVQCKSKLTPYQKNNNDNHPGETTILYNILAQKLCTKLPIHIQKQHSEYGMTKKEIDEYSVIQVSENVNLGVHQDKEGVVAKCNNEMPQERDISSNIVSNSGSKMTSRGNGVCVLCGKLVTHMKRHLAVHSAHRPFRCDVCKKSYKEERYLSEHKKIHFKKLDFICQICGYMTHSKTVMRQHERKHTVKCNFVCDICTKSFTSKSKLENHLLVHTGVRSYQCEKCGKAFYTKGNLYGHLKSHDFESAEKVQCDRCGKSVRHVQRHRRNCGRNCLSIERKMYVCDYCGKSLSRRFLKIHLRSHTGERPFSCSVCSKAFVDTRYLKMHLRSHTGEKPYSCDQCNKSFTQYGSLKIHKMSHSGQKPYKCDMCDKAFVTNTLLKEHKKRH